MFAQLPDWFPAWVPALLPEAVTALLAAVTVLGALSLIVALIALSRARRAEARYRQLLMGVEAPDLAAALERFADRQLEAERKGTSTSKALSSVDRRARRALQHAHLVRYGSFGDAAGQQSFSLALLDAQLNGVVLTALHARAGIRIYAKPVEGGRSLHALSSEEQRAIAEAAAEAESA